MTNYIEDIANILDSTRYSLEKMIEQTDTGIYLLENLTVPGALVIPEIPRQPMKLYPRIVQFKRDVDKDFALYYKVFEVDENIGWVGINTNKRNFYILQIRIFNRTLLKPNVQNVEAAIKALFASEFGLIAKNVVAPRVA